MTENRDVDRAKRLLARSTDEHSELLGAIRKVESMIEVQGAKPALGDVQRRVHELNEGFKAHVGREEAGDMYGWLPKRFAELKPMADRLLNEHERITAELSAVTAEVEKSVSIELRSELSARLRAALAALRRHEAAESQLLHAAIAQIDSDRG